MMTIHPHDGVDSVSFGMTRLDVRRVMGAVPKRARRSKYAESDYDFFQADGLFVYYDAADTCVAVEFTSNARVSYDGYELFAHPAHEVRAWARTQDPSLKEKDGFVSTHLGLSMYAPLIDEPDLSDDDRRGPGQSFLAFKRGYYDEKRR